MIYAFVKNFIETKQQKNSLFLSRKKKTKQNKTNLWNAKKEERGLICGRTREAEAAAAKHFC